MDQICGCSNKMLWGSKLPSSLPSACLHPPRSRGQNLAHSSHRKCFCSAPQPANVRIMNKLARMTMSASSNCRLEIMEQNLPLCSSGVHTPWNHIAYLWGFSCRLHPQSPPPPPVMRCPRPSTVALLLVDCVGIFPEEEGMMQHSRDKYFPRLWNQGYRTSRRITQHLVSSTCTQTTNPCTQRKRGVVNPSAVNCKIKLYVIDRQIEKKYKIK